MELITKYEIKVANTFCKKWAPTRTRTTKLDFWKQSEQQVQKWKIIDYIAVPEKQEALWQEIAGLTTLHIIGQ